MFRVLSCLAVEHDLRLVVLAGIVCFLASIAAVSLFHRAKATIRAVIGLGHGLNLPVSAEGVETTEQMNFLKHESCDEVQGFLFGRPQPIEAYAALVGREPAPAKQILRAG
jgi:sensor c-di-GMP phosphodiesterase-like protein